MCTKFWFENLNGIDHLEDLNVNSKIIKAYLREIRWGLTGLIWLSD
jgi:hypothetical protein